MRKSIFKSRKLTIGLLAGAMTLAQGFTSGASTPKPIQPLKADLTSETRTLDAFVDDILKLDKKSAELSKKSSLTRAEFQALQNSADDLKRQLSGLQNALQSIIKKLKDAGEWDELDTRAADLISDGATRTRFRQISLKRELEDASIGLTNSADDLSKPFEHLRKKVAGVPNYSNGSDLGRYMVAAAYHPESPVVTTGIKCTLAHMRYGLSRVVWGAVRAGADEAYNCACNIPSGYSCYSPPTT